MRAGEMDRRIQFQRRVSRRTRRGEPVDEWENLGKPVWARVRKVSGGRPEDYQEDQYVAKERKEFRVRYRGDIDAKCRILFEGRPWDIQSTTELGRRAGLDVLAEARGD